jgi:hypothetical protein
MQLSCDLKKGPESQSLSRSVVEDILHRQQVIGAKVHSHHSGLCLIIDKKEDKASDLLDKVFS